eukprot:CAMPEP_0179298142 /NCGR_PEP_ID=MMETSP0797-20121207/45839_1 /TAXON_ID=47934 /ORGANISM="Dinophysis acuminata, Strain DAEP01" /LENGTH=31 /DNA_ID= /DNA_START= /DNA_END= /DNA_ORIENTATION=
MTVDRALRAFDTNSSRVVANNPESKLQVADP